MDTQSVKAALLLKALPSFYLKSTTTISSTIFLYSTLTCRWQICKRSRCQIGRAQISVDDEDMMKQLNIFPQKSISIALSIYSLKAVAPEVFV